MSTTPTTLFESNLENLKLVNKGKVRDIYELDDDYLLIKISSITGILDPLFNAFNTPGYLVFDEGVNDTQLFVTFDPFQQRIILISIVSLGRSPTDSIRLRGLNLVQDDIGAVPPF